MPAEIVFIADDFGLSEEANQAIAHTYRRGVLDGASLLMGQPATESAVALARENPGLQVGLHVHLNDSTPCTRPAWPWGGGPAAAGLAVGISAKARAVVRRELDSQWRAFLATGLPCRFVNTHHHLHLHPVIRETLVATLGPCFAGWMRWGTPHFFGKRTGNLLERWTFHILQRPFRRRSPIRLSTSMWGIDRTFTMDAREVAGALPALGEGLHEFLFHPRRIGDLDSRCLLELASDPARRGGPRTLAFGTAAVCGAGAACHSR